MEAGEVKILYGREAGILDFYVSRKKWKTLKTLKSQIRFVGEQLDGRVFPQIIGNVVDNILIRDVSISSNNLWGRENFTIINDIGYSCNNLCPSREDDNLTIRIFGIDMIGIGVEKFKGLPGLIKYQKSDFLIVFNGIRRF